jgi:hypothetical protein
MGGSSMLQLVFESETVELLVPNASGGVVVQEGEKM